MFRFDDTCPVFFFLCAMFGVTISGRQLCGVNMKSLSLLANTGVPHPEITPRSAKFSTETRCRCQSRLCRSCTGRIPKRSERAATTWSDSNKSTVQSFEGHGKAEICREDTHGSHVSLRCFLEKNQFRNPPKTLDSLDSLDRKLALSYCQGFCF